MVYASKVEADEAIAVASVISIDRTEYMRADKVIGLEYLEHERRTWLWEWVGAVRVGGVERCGRNDSSYGGSGGAGAVGDGPTDLSDDICTGLGGC